MSKASVVVMIATLILLTHTVFALPGAVEGWIIVVGCVFMIILGLLIRIERQWLLRALQGGHRTNAFEESSAPKPRTAGSVE